MSSTTLPRSRAHRPVGPPPLPRSGPAATAGARYRYDRQSGRWSWSPELAAVLGLPSSTEPDTASLLESLPAADRARLLEAVAGCCGSAAAFALQVRVPAHGSPERVLVVLGEADTGPDGDVTAVTGLLADLTDGRPAEGDRLAALATEVEQMRAAMASRAAIEQAKGMLMLLLTCNEQVAFDLLTHISSHTHRKVRDIALAITESAAGHGRLPADVREILRDACPPTR